MKATDLIGSAVRNTFRSKLRTTLTVLALFIGAFTLTLTTAAGAGVTDYVTKQVASLGTDDVFIISRTAPTSTDGPVPYDPATSSASSGAEGTSLPGAGGSDPLTDADLAELAGIDGILSVDPVQGIAIDFIELDGGPQYEFSINPTSSITQADLLAGKQLTQDSSTNEIVIPSNYVESLGFADVEDAVGSTVQLGLTDLLGEHHTVDAVVVGVSQDSLLAAGAGANPALVAEAADLQSARIDTGPARYPLAVAYFDPSQSVAGIDALQAEISDAGFSAQTVQDQLGVIKTVIDGIVGVLNAFAIVALIAAAFGIVNTLLMSVQERTREIGLMKAMGMRGGKVFSLFSLEAAFIGFLGSAIGVITAVAIGTALNSILSAGPLSALPGLEILLFEPSAIIGVITLIMAIAFVSGTLPASRAARKNPIDSLRYE
ncbi:ABC transporter permease [Arthrobacter sp. 260]|uniref:ABC transporter permease n=1 Tax=Arthrobacter sp. 260 TaxID=2735314 RepID=UPI00149312D1|nr:ABC transporter permease [Arthrobacter sp. 260]NOJ61183.1 ABC transporter permease [Arthrobacter sp. 260]